MATKATLDDALNSITPELTKIFSKDYREELDKRLTILDLSYEALKVNVYRNTQAHITAYNEAYATLVTVLNEKATRQYSSLDKVPKNYFDNKNAPFIYINGGDSNRFLVASSFGAIRTFVTNSLSRDAKLIKTSFGQSTIYKEVLNKAGVPSGDVKKSTRTKIDIGHIATEDNENLVSPLELKISDILSLGKSLANPTIVSAAEKALQDLYSIQVDASYSFKNTAPEAVELARGVLGSGYVVVTLHRQKLNAAFSAKELEIFNKLKATIALKLSKIDFTNKSGSNTIIEDIAAGIGNIFTKGKLKKHNEKKVKSSTSLVPKVKLSSSVISIKKSNPLPTSSSGQIVQSTSLTSLQNLLDAQLQHVIAANMGNGSDRRVLNYRSGRFAASAKVERLTMSREGMITAFYTYMKNPYATFSTGGAQQFPKSRDPKLLISQSIREIAATKVANRLRAVAV